MISGSLFTTELFFMFVTLAGYAGVDKALPLSGRD
jgi:hypothetical protein